LSKKAKGFSIVYIPTRGHSRSFHLSAFAMYIAILLLLGSSYFIYQFYISLQQLRTDYITLTTFSEEEKQQIMSDENHVIDQEIAAINVIHSANKEKMVVIASQDKENRSKLGLRTLDLNPDKFITGDNKKISYSNASLSLQFTYMLKEKVQKQSSNLWKVNRTLEIASNSADEYLAQDAKTPKGYPCPGYIDPGFGWRTHPIFRIPDFHTGVDISVPEGGNLIATGDGVVTGTGYAGGYGIMVTVYHRDGISTRYAHCSSVMVKQGDKVTRGKIIAKGGHTGTATNDHVHYEVLIEGKPVDPVSFNATITEHSRSSRR